MLRRFMVWGWLGLVVIPGIVGWAHSGNHASVHDTVAAIALRLRDQLPEAALRKLTVTQVEAALTPAERDILGSHHLTWDVNVPVVLTVLRDPIPGIGSVLVHRTRVSVQRAVREGWRQDLRRLGKVVPRR